MTKTPKIKLQLEQNRQIITKMLSGVGTHKRLNNFNWLRHEIAYIEPRTLFYVPNKQQDPYLDYNSMRNIGEAYDYVLANPNKFIDATEICRIHSMMCANTNIHGGVFRSTAKILDLTVNGQKLHTPDSYEIPSLLNETVFKMHNTPDTLTRAFNVHYDLIMLQPFDDFNKRTSRMVMNWVLIQGGYRPIVFNQPNDKQKYKEAITKCASGDHKSYIAYMSACLLRTQNEIIKSLKKSRIM